MIKMVWTPYTTYISSNIEVVTTMKGKRLWVTTLNGIIGYKLIDIKKGDIFIGQMYKSEKPEVFTIEKVTSKTIIGIIELPLKTGIVYEKVYIKKE